MRPVVHKSENDVLNDSAGPVDLRMAAKKTVPAVVNVMTVQMRKEYYGNPLDFGLEEYNPRCVKCPEYGNRIGSDLRKMVISLPIIT